MTAEPELAGVARTLGDPTRVRMLMLLMEGRALTAKELAHGAGVDPATATSHLRRLVAHRLLAMTAQGRHKYFRLASAPVAHCVEALLCLAAPADRAVPRAEPIHQARFCYDHLAGRLGVTIAESLVQRRRVRRQGDDFALTPAGRRWAARFGLDVPAIEQQRRRFACGCLDWSERRHHVGGALGAALAALLLERRWIRRVTGTRVVQVTPRGREPLAAEFGFRG